MRQPKTDRDRLATKKVFSALGGLSHITEAEADYIGRENITTGVSHVWVSPMALGWLTAYTDVEGTERRLQSRWVVTTCGAYNLPELLPFVDKERMDAIASLKYAPVMEVNVGMPDTFGGDYCAFGGLVPTKERQEILGILFPSACFEQRAPKGGALFSYFIGGMRHAELLDKSQSRKNRIAKGSGQSLQEVSRMIKQFEQTRKMMKNVAGAKLPNLGSMMRR